MSQCQQAANGEQQEKGAATYRPAAELSGAKFENAVGPNRV